MPPSSIFVLSPPACRPRSQSFRLADSNMAAVHLKNSNYARALQCSDKALEKNKENTKASFRKATALNALGDVNKAKNLLDSMDKSGRSLSLRFRVSYFLLTLVVLLLTHLLFLCPSVSLVLEPSVKQLLKQISLEDKARSAKSDKDFRGQSSLSTLLSQTEGDCCSFSPSSFPQACSTRSPRSPLPLSSPFLRPSPLRSPLSPPKDSCSTPLSLHLAYSFSYSPLYHLPPTPPPPPSVVQARSTVLPLAARFDPSLLPFVSTFISFLPNSLLLLITLACILRIFISQYF